MTLGEALAELGVEAGAGAETVRRAYLRLIKSRKPETDPAGFQRARQAYELARAAAEMETLAAESERRHAPPALAVSAPSSGRPGGATPGSPGAGDVVFQGFLSAWRAVPASADQRQRLEVAREAVAVLPGDPRAHWLLARTLSGWGNDVPLAEALRAGWQQGWPEFLEALLLRVPGRVTRQEVDAAFASDRPMLRLAGASAASRWGDGSESAARVVEICAAARGETAALDEHLVGRMLDVALALEEAGAQAAGKAAHQAIATWLHDSGLELSLARGELGGVWTLAEELARLPADFPEALRRPFAAATRAGDLQIALADACGRAHTHPGEVRTWAERVRRTAPNVANILAAAERYAGAQRRASRSFNFRHLLWIAVPLCSWLVRTCNEPSRPSFDPGAVDPAALSALPVPAAPARPAGLEIARQGADELCGPGGPRRGQLVCADVEAVLAALDDGDCAESTERLQDLGDKLPRKTKGDLEDRVLTRLTLARWQMCGAAASHPPGEAAAP